MLTIWGRRDSSNVQAVMWCVGELGLPFERHDIGHRFGGNRTPEFLAMNPNGLVPVLADGDGEPIWEAGAILRYLAGRYGEDAFWPGEAARRAQVDKWAEWAKVTAAAAFTAPIFWRVVRTTPRDRDWSAIGDAVAAYARVLDLAEARLQSHDFLAGRTFTLADVQFGHVLYRYHEIEIERPDHPAVRRYYDRLTGRPAFRRHVMISYEALRAV